MSWLDSHPATPCSPDEEGEKQFLPLEINHQVTDEEHPQSGPHIDAANGAFGHENVTQQTSMPTCNLEVSKSPLPMIFHIGRKELYSQVHKAYKLPSSKTEGNCLQRAANIFLLGKFHLHYQKVCKMLCKLSHNELQCIICLFLMRVIHTDRLFWLSCFIHGFIPAKIMWTCWVREICNIEGFQVMQLARTDSHPWSSTPELICCLLIDR